LIATLGMVDDKATPEDPLLKHARELSAQYTILDTHIDVPYRLWKKKGDDISRTTEGGDFDHPRALAGGLDGCFMSIYTPAKLEKEGTSKALADSLIDMVEGFAVESPNKFTIAVSPAEVRAAKKTGKFALLLGMENGSPIEGDLDNLRHFYRRGVRYITLAHSKDNHISDSSYDDRHTSKGLTAFGRTVVREMNRLGVIVDVSHISDDAFYQVMEISKAPVIASHSSCRHFTPGFERNMSDDMIRLLAEKGGVIHINFGSTFISERCRQRYEAAKTHAENWARENELETSDKRVKEWRDAYLQDHPVGFADVSDVADHIDHVVKVAGVDHVGFGSDFDGVGDTLPTGLKDVSYYPNLIRELLARGYQDEDIEKICSANLLRVWSEVERVASDLSSR
jgi:membrane dipeptidase